MKKFIIATLMVAISIGLTKSFFNVPTYVVIAEDEGIKINIDKDKLLEVNEKKYITEFHDESLIRKIEEVIGKDRVNITNDDLFDIKSLDINNLGIKSLEGIQYLTNLRMVNLAYNDIEDITPVSDLKKLVYFYGENNRIKDIASLTYCERLESINVSNNDMKDISDLSALKKLKGLSMKNNNIENIDFIKSNYSLEMVNLSNNNIKDLSPIQNLKDLKWLFLSNNDIEDVEVLQSFKRFEVLDINGNNIKNFDPLDKIKIN